MPTGNTSVTRGDHAGPPSSAKQLSGKGHPREPETRRLLLILFEADENKPGTGGTVTLWANHRPICEGTMPRAVPVGFSSYSGVDIGRDNGLVVDRAYEAKPPYVFAGTVKQVVFDLKPTRRDNEQALHEHASLNAVGYGAGA
jgi:hypothetical protein